MGTYSIMQHLLRKVFGEDVYSASYYLRDLSFYAGLFGFLCSFGFVGNMYLSTHLTSAIFLATIFSGAYYLSLRGVMLFTFSKRFSTILSTRYGITEKVQFDACTAKATYGDVASYVANHLATQLETSSKVVLPIGMVGTLMIFTALLYLPLVHIQALLLSGSFSLFASVLMTLNLLPQLNSDKPVSSMKASSAGSLLPPVTFISLLTLTTPIAFVLTRNIGASLIV